MKKTLTMNLGGTVYHIDEDAYRLLDDYLKNLRLHFRKQQGADEIVNDMENRIAELFSERVVLGKQVITISDVEEVIERMGRPEDFGDVNEDSGIGKKPEQSGDGEGRTSYWNTTVKRRLYRDPDDKMLSGVAAGLAAYLGWDVTLVRILMVIFVFIPYCPMIIIYLVGWIVIPEAHTATEKLSMRGEAVTVENIGKTVTDGFERVSNGVNDYVNSGKPRSFLQKSADLFVSVVAFVFKLILVIIAIALCPFLFIAAVALIAAIVGIAALLLGIGATLFSQLPTSLSGLGLFSIAWDSPWTYIAWIILILFISIPMFALVHTILRSIFDWDPMPKWLRNSLVFTWIISLPLIFLSIFCFGHRTTVETTRQIHDVIIEEPIYHTDTVHNKDTIQINSL